MDCQTVIIGAGAAGLSSAVKLAEKYKNIIVLERHSSFGKETSSRNSEVIHAGIYYRENSLKARLCTAGNKSLYEWCRKHYVPHRRIGKYIAAVNNSEIKELDNIYSKAVENGVDGIEHVPISYLRKEEPNVKAAAGLCSPSTGIIDSHNLMRSLETKAAAMGVSFAYNHCVTGVEKIPGGYNLKIKTNDGDNFHLETETVVNSAGLNADIIASLAGIDIKKAGYEVNFVKGHYFRLKPKLKGLVKHLIYPVPPNNMTFLGIHLTIELDGGMKLGPDIKWMENRIQDYHVPENLREKFFANADQYLKGLTIDDIYPDQAGIRPKLQTKGGEFRDFIINEESERGLPGFVNLIGIESPGLTCCLEIGNYVKNLL